MKKYNIIRLVNNKKFELFIYFSMLFTALDGVVGPYFMAKMIDAIQNNNQFLATQSILYGLGSYIFVRSSLYFWEAYQQKYIEFFNYKVKQSLIVHSFANKQFQIEDNYHFIINDVKLLENNYIRSYFNLIYCIAFAGVAIIYMFSINFSLAMIFIAFSTLPLIPPKVLKNKLKNETNTWRKENEKFIQMYQDNTQGYLDIAIFRRSEYFLSRLLNILKVQEHAYLTMNTNIFISRFISNLVGGISTYVPLLIGIFFIVKNYVSLANFIALYLTSDRVISPLLNASNHYGLMMTTESIREKIYAIWNRKSVTNDCYSDDIRLPITFKNTQLGYDDKIVITVPELTVFPKDKILIIGPSGSGKTTIFKSLFGLSKLYSGTISSNGNNSGIGYYQQDNFLFDSTIRFNLTLGDTCYSEEEIINAIEKVKLKDLVADQGLDFKVGKNGCNLSGGQRARVALARILLRKYPLVLLDEFSSSLDMKTQEDIRVCLHKEFDTIMEISHSINENNIIYTKVYTIEDGVLKRIK